MIVVTYCIHHAPVVIALNGAYWTHVGIMQGRHDEGFISSTSVDLSEYLKAAIEVCEKLALEPVATENFAAMSVGQLSVRTS
jgi:uncharacterized protein DUF4062